MDNTINFWLTHANEIEEIIGYKFKNINLLLEAFTHCSFSNEAKLSFTNERLEFLGDAVLDLIATEYIYINFPELKEGPLTSMRSRVVDAKACYNYSVSANIEKYVLLGKGERLHGKPGRQTILANLFEALIGAIYIDGQLDDVKQFLFKFIKPAVDKTVSEPSNNWKACLQELTQQLFKVSPQYKVVGNQGPDHHKEYICAVFINDEHMGEGSGKSKKEAHQIAAKQAFEKLKKIEKDE